jgi:hypothetical protein
MSVTTPATPAPSAIPSTSDSFVQLHRLTMVPEDGGVMVGRPDIGSYALFPVEGAEALRRLDAGQTLSTVADWYERASGETLDVADFLAALADLGFLRADGEDHTDPGPVRWQRLGKWLFSWPAWLGYLALTTAAIVAMVGTSTLRPSWHNLFFTSHLTLIPLTLTFTQIPCILVHEAFHALAGRRLGLPSTLGIGRRLYYVVAETRLDSLLSVPRRQRYLPFFAGMVADAIIISGLTLASSALAGHGLPGWLPALCLAVAFTCLLRLIWQVMFYLETDLYYAVSTALRCADLQNATRFRIKTQWRRLLRRPAPEQAGDWSDRDLAVARWYEPLLLAGYAFSLGSLVWAGIPTLAHFWTTVYHRLWGTGTATGDLLDAITFIALTSAQGGVLGYVFLRDRRKARATQPGGAL